MKDLTALEEQYASIVQDITTLRVLVKQSPRATNVGELRLLANISEVIASLWHGAYTRLESQQNTLQTVQEKRDEWEAAYEEIMTEHRLVCGRLQVYREHVSEADNRKVWEHIHDMERRMAYDQEESLSF